MRRRLCLWWRSIHWPSVWITVFGLVVLVVVIWAVFRLPEDVPHY